MAGDPLLAEFRAACPLPLTVVGVGNTMRGDDGFGPAVLAGLPELDGVTCLDAGMAPENWLGPIARSAPAAVLVLDAGDLGEPPGTLRLVEPDALDAVATSTHGLPLGFFVDLLAQECPAPVHILVAQASSAAFGEPLSGPVAAAVERAAALIRTLSASA
jgi:hydrogenase 3 maturation protease